MYAEKFIRDGVVALFLQLNVVIVTLPRQQQSQQYTLKIHD